MDYLPYAFMEQVVAMLFIRKKTASFMNVLSVEQIQQKIYTIRGMQVMLDGDLAELYQTETKYINRALKRNPNRFPDHFAFQLIHEEYENLRFQSGTSSGNHGGRRYMPHVFTEQGVAMLSAVLQTDIAIKVSIQIMEAFVQARKMLHHYSLIGERLSVLERKQLQTDQHFDKIFQALEQKQLPPEKGIFFDGQIFDAYVFAAGLIKQAQSSLILIDNYVDESVLQLLTKRKAGVKATVYTKTITNALKQDLKKHNSQYEPLEILALPHSHDRFLILDQKELYHIGASLKDLGKKWFAFSKMSDLLPDLLTKLPER